MMVPGRRWFALLVALVGVLPLTACASIPDSSDLIPVRRVDEGDVQVPIPAPRANLDAFELVRSFVDHSAEPENDYAAAREHLTPQEKNTWNPPQQMLIVDFVDTIPLPSPAGTPVGVQWVSVQATKVGWLEPDQSFVPDAGQYSAQLRVERQPDGQWRIATPPTELVASRESFTGNYRAVPIFFLDHNRTGVVPDLRYVVSQPASTLPRRVVDLLVMGPSQTFRSAMGTALPAGVHPQTNVSEADDGALVVNLSSLGTVPVETRRLIAAQVVLSLARVSNSRVRLQEDGAPLLTNQEELRPADVASYDTAGAVRQGVPGLAVVDERLRSLDQRAAPVPGPTGSGELAVIQAGQSPDGSQLAVVVRRPAGGVELQVGRYGAAPVPMAVVGSFMSKPTWRGNNEFWTVVDGQRVVRVTEGPDGRWQAFPVDARAFAGGHQIGDLRLSRDGTRVAGVVDGGIVVGGVSDQNGQTVLQLPVVLSGGPQNATVTSVDWLDDESLVAITESSAAPVVGVTADGFKWTTYASENLTEPMGAITVTPDHKVVVADHSGVWQVSGPGDVWHLLPVPIGGSSIPFYPG